MPEVQNLAANLQIEYRSLSGLVPYAKNARQHSQVQVEQIAESIRRFGFTNPVLLDGENGVIAGHGRILGAALLGLEDVPCIELRHLTADEKRAYIIADNQLALTATWSEDLLRSELGALKEADFPLSLTGFSPDQLDEFLKEVAPKAAAPAEAPKSLGAELNEKWNVRPGDLWAIGPHRLLCGDSTLPENVERLMAGERAALCHADPPCGMGKEKDGIENDNLHAGKLDVFLMAWWRAWRPALDDNASAYIWGCAADLWRLWYAGGLSASERLTFRNEIVWAKGSAGAGGISHIGAEGLRLYPQETERCLFFMLGEQGFNSNADNYWQGWEPIRSYLAEQVAAAGLGPDDIKRITGVGMFSHWFSKSQWVFIPEDHYKKLQAEVRGKAFEKDYGAFSKEYNSFKADYDELKKQFYGTRAYFDNQHDNMTDVWTFSRVNGEDRWEHATPKPVDLVMRAIKSSTPEGATIVAPFAGSGSDFVAAQTLGRKCRGMEISPDYCALILERMTSVFPQLEAHCDR